MENSKMNALRVECEKKFNEDGDVYYDVTFLVDETPLVDLVRAYEAGFAADLAGEYTNIYYGYYTEPFLLGAQGEHGSHGTKTELLGCTCGCRGCWPLAVLIRSRKGKVFWEDFEQPHRDWDYSRFGPFVFDLEQYKSAIAVIPAPPPDSEPRIPSWRRS